MEFNLIYFVASIAMLVIFILICTGICYFFTRENRYVCKVIRKALLRFVSKYDLPKYNSEYGQRIDWDVISLDKLIRYNIRTGKKCIVWEVVCSGNYSDYMFNIELSVEEYENLKNGELDREILIDKFNKKCKVKS